MRILEISEPATLAQFKNNVGLRLTLPAADAHKNQRTRVAVVGGKLASGGDKLIGLHVLCSMQCGCGSQEKTERPKIGSYRAAHGALA